MSGEQMNEQMAATLNTCLYTFCYEKLRVKAVCAEHPLVYKVPLCEAEKAPPGRAHSFGQCYLMHYL